MTLEQFEPIARVCTIAAGLVTLVSVACLYGMIRDDRRSDDNFLHHNIFGWKDIPDDD